MLVALYEASWIERWKRLEKEEKEWQEHEEYLRREAVKKRYNQEVDRLYALMNEAKDYESALRIRAYADAREKAGTADAQWLQWAREKADWLDPTVARKDEFFGQRQHGNAPKYKDPEKKWQKGSDCKIKTLTIAVHRESF